MLTTYEKYRKVIKSLSFLIITVITFSSQIAMVSTAGAIEALTIRAAIQTAFKNNSGLELEKQNIELSEVSVGKNRGTFYPDLSIESGGSFREEQGSSTGNGNNYQTFDVNITSTLNIFNGLKDSSALKKSKIELEAEKKSYTRVSQTIIFNTISNYIEVVSNQKLINAEAENLNDNQKQLEQMQAFYDSGKISITDLYQQQAETKEAELSLLTAKKSFKVSMLKLLQSMGLDTNYQFSVDLPEVVYNDTTFPDYGYDVLLKAAYDARSDLKSGKSMIDAAEEGIREAKSGYLPSVNLFAEVGSDYSSRDDEGFSNQMTDNGIASAIGFNVSIPIFDGFVTKSNLSEARINRKTRVLEQKKLKQEIQLEIGEALEGYRTAVKRLEVTAALLKYSKKVVDSMVAKYAAGASSITDLIEVRSNYAKAKYNNITAGYDLLQGKVALAYYKGDVSVMMSL